MTQADMPDAIRRAVHGWIREVAPLAAKMNLMPRHIDALVERVGQAICDFPEKGSGGRETGPVRGG